MTYKLILVKKLMVDPYPIWWENFLHHVLRNNPLRPFIVDPLGNPVNTELRNSLADGANEKLKNWNARFEIDDEYLPCVIFDSVEDYFAFVLEWS